MKIQKISYKVPDRGMIQHHYAVFLTQSNDVIFHGSFFNSNDARKISTDIMNKKEKSRSFFIIPGLVAWDSTTLDKNLVNLAKSNQLADCVIIENIEAGSIISEEHKRFAKNYFKGIHS